MNKEQKVLWIKCWLQKFGERDNETFNTEVTLGDTHWDISIQYNYDFDGYEISPNDWCINGFKHTSYNHISDRSEEELDQIIKELSKRKLYA